MGQVWIRSEYIRCGKDCAKCPYHGPYWYRYERTDGKMHKKYLGRILELHHVLDAHGTLPVGRGKFGPLLAAFYLCKMPQGAFRIQRYWWRAWVKENCRGLQKVSIGNEDSMRNAWKCHCNGRR
jgi:hypothetical protein